MSVHAVEAGAIAPAIPPAATAAPRKAALASWIGSAVEYYDFFIYGAAASLIFPKLFFSPDNPQAALMLSFATFGVAYIARPFGAIGLGHIGDRFGRKRVLTFTLLLMGFSTFIIGCLPTYAQAGLLAPTLLVLARFMQGISAAGEQAGANSMTLEHAPADQRAFFTSFTLSGTQAGLILANLVFLPITALPEEQLLSWGWRIPFFLSALVVAVGFWVRRSLPETPVFEEEKAQHKEAALPVVTLFRTQSADLLRVIFAALVSVVSTIGANYVLAYAVREVKISQPTTLLVLILANVVALAAIPLWAKLADRIGRRPVFIAGALGSAVTVWPLFWAVSTGNVPLMFVFGVLLSGVVYSAANGVWPSLYGEMFDTRVRLSGMAIGTQIGFALGGFAPTIAAAIQDSGPTGWYPVAGFVTLTCLISAFSVYTARETYRTPLHELGRR